MSDAALPWPLLEGSWSQTNHVGRWVGEYVGVCGWWWGGGEGGGKGRKCNGEVLKSNIDEQVFPFLSLARALHVQNMSNHPRVS